MKLNSVCSISLFAVLCTGTLVGFGPDATAQGMVGAARKCDRMGQMSPLQRRLVDKAASGPAALRQFIWATRGIYQLDMANVVAWLDQERDARRVCVAAASQLVASH